MSYFRSLPAFFHGGDVGGKGIAFKTLQCLSQGNSGGRQSNKLNSMVRFVGWSCDPNPQGIPSKIKLAMLQKQSILEVCTMNQKYPKLIRLY